MAATALITAQEGACTTALSAGPPPSSASPQPEQPLAKQPAPAFNNLPGSPRSGRRPVPGGEEALGKALGGATGDAGTSKDARIAALEARVAAMEANEAKAWNTEEANVASTAQQAAILDVAAENEKLRQENASMKVEPALAQAALHNENARLRAEHDALVMRLAQVGLGPVHDPQWFLRGGESRIRLP